MKVPSLQIAQQLLTPSWLSSAFNIVVAVFLVAVSAVTSRLTNNTLQQELFAVHDVTASTSAGYQVVTNNLARNAFISNLPLTLFWVGIGAIVYYFTINIYKAFSRAVSLEQSLHYVHANRRQLIRQAIERLIVRIVSLLIGLVYVHVCLRVIIPYSLELARSSVKHLDGRSAIGLIEAIAILMLMFYGLTVMLRLFLLRTRVFTAPS